MHNDMSTPGFGFHHLENPCKILCSLLVKRTSLVIGIGIGSSHFCISIGNHLGFQIKNCNSKLIFLFLIKGLDKIQCSEYQF